jgi:isocitrate dehydrogenase kinase/phosphatase
MLPRAGPDSNLTRMITSSNQVALGAAAAIHDAFDAYHVRFKEVTGRATRRFETRDWHGAWQDATERLALYREHLDAVLRKIDRVMGSRVTDVAVWVAMRDAYATLVAARDDSELGETFFNSVTRRTFTTVGVDPRIEFLAPHSQRVDPTDEASVYRSVTTRSVDAGLVRYLLSWYRWSVPYRQVDAAAERAAGVIRGALGWGEERDEEPEQVVIIDLLDTVFYRNKGAYLVGRIRRGGKITPLLFALLNTDRGIVLDAVLTTQDEASIVFGFSWSYFRVQVRRPNALVGFLSSIMPHKRVDELYTSLGYNRHGKTELYRSLLGHMAASSARFEFAEGAQGLVMSVFTLPSLNVVFKVIKDTFGQPKRTTRKTVMEKYRLVFLRDRAGRLADAQEFEHLELPAHLFSDALLVHLLTEAAETVRVEGDRVVVGHCYTERRVTPLDVFLRKASADEARDAIVEYGNAIKDLAGANIFTGDMLLKNFGVTRHGRVIFYDYDELTLLEDCNFRRLPAPSNMQEEMAAEPWYHVGEQDVFPQEFPAFLIPPGDLRDAFLAVHADLFDVGFWRDMQARLATGELCDVFPYRPERRLRWE